MSGYGIRVDVYTYAGWIDGWIDGDKYMGR